MKAALFIAAVAVFFAACTYIDNRDGYGPAEIRRHP